MASRDRRAAVLRSTTSNGIDFVAVANTSQTQLVVHFLNAVDVEPGLLGIPTITGGEIITSVAVVPLGASDWGWDDGHQTLTLRVLAPGDFSTYLLTIPSTRLDRFFASVPFSFKAGCPSDLDCRPIAPSCQPTQGDAPPIDYLSKDFLSFRQALLDFSTLRYPSWQERSEADFGVMFLESLSAIADELSYIQDRVANEASLLTASQRRSVQRHARLVDYESSPAQGARTVLQFEVGPGVTSVPHNLAAIAPGPDGTPLTFESGLGLRDTSAAAPASPLWNRSQHIAGYWFDDSTQCLPAGATQMYVAGRGYGFVPGQTLLIETAAASSADPPLRQLVHLLQPGDPAGPWSTELSDPLFPIPPIIAGPPFMTYPSSPPQALEPAAVTLLRWESTDALAAARDLANTIVVGNITDATQGQTVHEQFLIGPAAPAAAIPGFSTIPLAIERTGLHREIAAGVCGDAAVIRLYTLAQAPLTWLANTTLDVTGLPVPEIVLSQPQSFRAGGGTVEWRWHRWLLTAGQFEPAFTIDAAAYRSIAQNSDGSLQSEYDGDAGDTIRFGDGIFGANPDSGMQFDITYRYGAGAAGNVAAGAITQLPQATSSLGFTDVMNPFAAAGGSDAQSLTSVKRLAPQAFSAVKMRAVVADDYADAAITQPFVKRAGTQFRWTGSWLTTFTTAEPVTSEQLAIGDKITLIALLNRYRMAGTESYVPDPDYVSIDLIVQVCAQPAAFAAGVQQAIVAALSPNGPNAVHAFFAVSNFAFGQPLERSRLEAAIQAVPGVAGVTCIEYRLRDLLAGFTDMGDTVPVGTSQIIRCDNDPSRANNGSLTVIVSGGR